MAQRLQALVQFILPDQFRRRVCYAGLDRVANDTDSPVQTRLFRHPDSRVPGLYCSDSCHVFGDARFARDIVALVGLLRQHRDGVARRLQLDGDAVLIIKLLQPAFRFIEGERGLVRQYAGGFDGVLL